MLLILSRHTTHNIEMMGAILSSRKTFSRNHIYPLNIVPPHILNSKRRYIISSQEKHTLNENFDVNNKNRSHLQIKYAD